LLFDLKIVFSNSLEERRQLFFFKKGFNCFSRTLFELLHEKRDPVCWPRRTVGISSQPGLPDRGPASSVLFWMHR
jgi:hypothetical protein